MLTIKKEVVAGIFDHARRDAPLEACGLLAETAGIICAFYPLTNLDAATDHFTLDPKEQFEVIREMRKRGQKLKALYHSHPVTEARPSAEDIRLAYDPEISYVIISLLGEGCIRSFRIKDSVIEEEEIKII